ncbi:hypothetical protein KAR91_69785 [Candidatus Pacearchaeota archaeon]|nr:hypothetical protein [Candidatus Pacearchaeota archaeon]
MFEKAARMKLRFDTDIGLLCAEDLWDLRLTQLNRIAKILKRTIKDAEEEDFLKETDAADAVIKLQFDITLHILTTKKNEAADRKGAAARKEEREKLLRILSKKQDSALEDLSEEDLKKKLVELGG